MYECYCATQCFRNCVLLPMKKETYIRLHNIFLCERRNSMHIRVEGQEQVVLNPLALEV